MSARSSAPCKCKECGGSQICEHGRRRSLKCKVERCPRSAVSIWNLRARSSAQSLLQGVRWVSNLRARSSIALTARSAAGFKSASTVVSGGGLKKCGAMCQHGRECGGASICEHGRRRSQCARCGGASSASTIVGALTARSARKSQICEHGRQRSQCKECGLLHRSASTVVSALGGGSVQGVYERRERGAQICEERSSALSARCKDCRSRTTTHEILVFNRSQLRRRPGPRPVARALTSVAP